jgi:hypothetical protein
MRTVRHGASVRGIAAVLVSALVALAAASAATAQSSPIRGLFGEDGGVYDLFPCLDAPPDSHFWAGMFGSMGTTRDATGALHVSIHANAEFHIRSTDQPDAELLYRGLGQAHFTAVLPAGSEETTTPWQTVTFPVRELGTGNVTNITVGIFFWIAQEGIVGGGFGEARCAAT